MMACSKWNTPEAIDFSPSATEKRDAGYIENLLAFKARKTHKLSLAMINSVPGKPSRANQHLTAYPDSLDYIALVGTRPLYKEIASEMKDVRRLGTKILHMVDYSVAYDKWFEEHLELEEGFLSLLESCIQEQLDALDAYNYDGILVSYLGKTGTDIEERAQNKFLDAVNAWIAENEGKTVIFRGYTRNLMDPSFLNKCEYIIIVPGTSASVGQLTLTVNSQMTAGVPKDRLMMEVPIQDALDGDKKGPTAAQAAEWIMEYTSGISKKGMAFSNAQDDYYNPERTFSEIRNGIKLSN